MLVVWNNGGYVPAELPGMNLEKKVELMLAKIYFKIWSQSLKINYIMQTRHRFKVNFILNLCKDNSVVNLLSKKHILLTQTTESKLSINFPYVGIVCLSPLWFPVYTINLYIHKPLHKSQNPLQLLIKSRSTFSSIAKCSFYIPTRAQTYWSMVFQANIWNH